MPSPMSVEPRPPKRTAIVSVIAGAVDPGTAKIKTETDGWVGISVRIDIRSRHYGRCDGWLRILLCRRGGLTINLSFQLSNHVLLGLQLAFEFSDLLPLLIDKGVEATRLRVVAVL